MLDEDFKVYLIEINSNPCLEIVCNLLSRIIPNMLDNALRYFYKIRIALDPIFPPPINILKNLSKSDIIPENIYENNKFEIIFDEIHDR